MLKYAAGRLLIYWGYRAGTQLIRSRPAAYFNTLHTKRRHAWTPGRGAARQQRRVKRAKRLSACRKLKQARKPEIWNFKNMPQIPMYNLKKNRNFQTWHRIFFHLKRRPHKTPYMGTFIFHEQKVFKVSEKLKILFRSKTKKPATNGDFEPKLKKKTSPTSSSSFK